MKEKTIFYEDKEISVSTLRLREIKRLILWHFYSKKTPLFLVTEFPKSGGTWFAKMLSDFIEVPFPTPSDPPKLEKSILRGTKLYSKHFKNIVVIMRDGRDVMVSAYFHMLFDHQTNKSSAVEKTREILNFGDFHDIENNMPRFIDYMFTEYPKIGYSTRFSWADFVNSWINVENQIIVKYEDLLSNPFEIMISTSKTLSGKDIDLSTAERIIDKYSFKNMTGRKNGEENRNSFARKGVAGDWKNYFNQEAKQIFHYYAGSELLLAGYEKDNSWLDKH